MMKYYVDNKQTTKAHTLEITIQSLKSAQHMNEIGQVRTIVKILKLKKDKNLSNTNKRRTDLINQNLINNYNLK